MTNLTALFAGVILATLLVACDSKPTISAAHEIAATAPASTSVANPEEDGEVVKIKKLKEDLTDILDPNATAYGPSWKADYNGENIAPCEVRSKYARLASFLEGLDPAIKLEDLSNVDLLGEAKQRGIAYGRSVVAALKVRPIPGCLLSDAGTDARFPASLVDDVTTMLEKEKLTPEDVGTSGKELRQLYLALIQRDMPKLLADFNANKSDDAKRRESLDQLIDLVQERHFTAAELGISGTDYSIFANAKSMGEGGWLLPGEKEPG